MKKTLLLALTMILAGAISAQNEMAILSHNGTLTDYYGTTALQAALSAAVSGDIVTVSSGSFSISGIPEGVTVRGNGFEEDLVAGGIMPTIVTYSSNSGSLPINKSAVVEGIRFNDNVMVSDSIHFLKCYFEDYMSLNNDPKNLEIVNCYIYNLNNGRLNDCVVTNCIIYNYGVTSVNNGGRTQVNNCIIGDVYYQTLNQTITPDIFTGCILMTTSNGSSQRKGINCYNCIGICRGNADGYQFFAASGDTAINYTAYQAMTQAQQDSVEALSYTQTSQVHHNWNAGSMAEVFKYITSVTAAPRTDYSFTDIYDTLATQLNIGIFKGMMPYTPFVNRPRYVRTNAAPRTTSDGKLSVDIQVVTVED